MFLSLTIALHALSAHKLRAVLAMIGVFLGALALSAVYHVSLAMEKAAEREIEKLGPNLFMARSGQLRMRPSGTASASRESKTFTIGDAQALLDGLPGAISGTPFVKRNSPIRNGDVTVTCQLLGVWPEYQEVRAIRPELGRFITHEDDEAMSKVCVLGAKIAERLFGSSEAALGRAVMFFRSENRVIGVLEPKGADIEGTDQDEQVFVPLNTYMRRYANQDWITGVYVQFAPGVDPDDAKAAATEILRGRHNIMPGAKDDFSVMTARDTIKLQQQALDLVQTLGLISSGVSFAVGGLGILSIMVLMVRARRMEIGIRRAVGARKSEIVRQFLLEAGIMSGAGGACGVAVSILVLLAVYRIGDFPTVFDPLVILGTLIGSGVIGVAAGSYPASQAAGVEILDVLRGHE